MDAVMQPFAVINDKGPFNAPDKQNHLLHHDTSPTLRMM